MKFGVVVLVVGCLVASATMGIHVDKESDRPTFTVKDDMDLMNWWNSPMRYHHDHLRWDRRHHEHRQHLSHDARKLLKMMRAMGLEKEFMYMYLAKKLDMHMTKMMMAKFMGVDMHDVDKMSFKDMMGLVAKRMGVDPKMMDVDVMKMLMVKRLMDVDMMRMMFAKYTGMDSNSLDVDRMKMMLSDYDDMGVGANTMDDPEMMKMMLAKYMMDQEIMDNMDFTMGPDTMRLGLMHPYYTMPYDYHRV